MLKTLGFSTNGRRTCARNYPTKTKLAKRLKSFCVPVKRWVFKLIGILLSQLNLNMFSFGKLSIDSEKSDFLITLAKVS